jgi:hypothetical protein
VVVPFQASSLGGGWGIMTQQASNFPGSRDGRPGVVTVGDLGCVEPMFSDGGTFYGMGVDLHCTAASAFNLVDSAVAGPIAIAGGDGTTGSLVTEPPADNPGFVIWIAGEMFSFELAPGAPVPSNTVWTLRSYIGSIFQSNAGAYSFRPGLRSFSAIGATLRLTYTADNRLVPLTGENGSVANVHTVPDPYYRLRQVAAAADLGVIRFVNLPPRCTIRIYTANGILVRVLQHNNVTTGTENWDIRNRNGQIVGSGVYFYSAEDSHTGIRRVGRMTVVN